MQLVITFSSELIEKDGRGWAPFQASAAVFPYRIVDEADTRNSRLILKKPSEMRFEKNTFFISWPDVGGMILLHEKHITEFKLV